MEKYLRHVYYHETDQMGVVHHSNYLKWMEEARIYLLDKVGISYKHLESIGIISPVVSININYLYPAKFDDDVIVKLNVKRYNGSKIEFDYEIYNSDNVVCVKAHSVHCFLKDNNIFSLRREYIEFHNIFMKYIEENNGNNIEI